MAMYRAALILRAEHNSLIRFGFPQRRHGLYGQLAVLRGRPCSI